MINNDFPFISLVILTCDLLVVSETYQFNYVSCKWNIPIQLGCASMLSDMALIIIHHYLLCSGERQRFEEFASLVASQFYSHYLPIDPCSWLLCMGLDHILKSRVPTLHLIILSCVVTSTMLFWASYALMTIHSRAGSWQFTAKILFKKIIRFRSHIVSRC